MDKIGSLTSNSNTADVPYAESEPVTVNKSYISSNPETASELAAEVARESHYSSESEDSKESHCSRGSDIVSEYDSTQSDSPQESDASDISDGNEELPSPQRLKILSSKVQTAEGNYLLHRFVLDYSSFNDEANKYVNAILLSMADIAVNDYNEDGCTALHLAVLQNSAFMVKQLLSCLGNIDIDRSRNTAGHPTALHLAIRCGYFEIVKELLQQGADVNKCDGYGCTPLSEAESACNVEVVKLLLDHGANVDAKCSRGETVLFKAAMGGSDTHDRQRRAMFGDRTEIIKLLLDRGADVNAKDANNCTPLHCAVQFKFNKAVKVLLEKGADVNSVNNFGYTPLHFAAIQQCGKILVQLLMKSGADVNARTMDGCTPLHLIAMNKTIKFIESSKRSFNRLEVAKLFLESGGYVDDKDNQYNTPLYFAGKSGDLGMVKLLIKYGGDVTARANKFTYCTTLIS